MAKVYEFLANGFEEVEALAPVDILRRGGVEVKTVSITGSPLVESSHGVMVKADLQIEDLGVIDDADMLLIPGGMPGAQNLKDDARVGKALLHQVESGKHVGAICAGPMVLGALGILKGKRATCYPGFEKFLTGAEYTKELCTIDGNVTTGKGPAAAFVYGFKLLEQLVSVDKANEIREGMLINELIALH